jgi:hypothetical protein
MPADGTTPRPLVAAPLHAIGFPWRVLGQSFGFAFLGAMVVAASCAPMFDKGSWGDAIALFVVFWLLCAWILAADAVRRARSTSAVVDEGGVRCQLGELRNYWPFALVGRGAIEGGGVTLRALVLEDKTGRPFLRMPIFRRAVEEDARALLDAYEARRTDAPPALPAVAASVERQGRPIAAWQLALDTLVKGGDDAAYRGRVVDFEGLADVAADTRQPPELRAGAAYAVLAGAPEEIKATVRARIGESAPPIVLLMATLAASSDARLAADLEKAAPYLEEDERAALVVRR